MKMHLRNSCLSMKQKQDPVEKWAMLTNRAVNWGGNCKWPVSIIWEKMHSHTPNEENAN